MKKRAPRKSTIQSLKPRPHQDARLVGDFCQSAHALIRATSSLLEFAFTPESDIRQATDKEITLARTRELLAGFLSSWCQMMKVASNDADDPERALKVLHDTEPSPVNWAGIHSPTVIDWVVSYASCLTGAFRRAANLETIRANKGVVCDSDMDRLLNAWSNIRETLNTIDLYDPQEVETRIDWIQTRALLKQELLASGKPPSWISATKATRLSEKLDLPLTLPAITKLAQKNPPAFQSRSVRGNRREVDIGSFVAYLLSQKNLPGNKDEEDDSMSKTDIRKRMELERKKKEAERDVGDYPE